MPPQQPGGLKDMELAFKRDPRLVDPFRGIGEWVFGSSYPGALAQDTVEARVEGVNAAGKPVKISAEWSASDPGMVTISPSKGEDVKITVHKEGESKIKVSYQGLTKELTVRAENVGKFIRFDLFAVAPASGSGPAAVAIDSGLKEGKEQISYAAGMRLAKTLRAQSVEVDPDLVLQGMKDTLAGRATRLTEGQERVALAAVETQLNVTEAVIYRQKIAEKNKQEAEKFLAENSKKDGVVTLPDGLQYKVLQEGNGKKPRSVDVAVCQYKGSLIDGTVFDDSRQGKGGGPVNFPVRAVIKGWQEALKIMPEGSRWQIWVPPDLAYGERGVPKANIPPNAALIFDVELLAVKGPVQQPAAAQSPAPAALAPEQPEGTKKTDQAQDKEPETKREVNQ